MALHTIQDAVSHNGKRWVSTHKTEAEAMGHKNEHPDFAEVVQEKGSDKAFNLTEASIEFIQGKNQVIQKIQVGIARKRNRDEQF